MKAVEKAYATIRRGILEGTYPAASRVTEQEIAVLSGVSRTPVREALRRLQAEGLLRFVPNQGAVVAAWSHHEVEEIFALRALLESYAAERAALRASPAQITALGRLADRQQALSARPVVKQQTLTEIADLNSRFHQTLQEAAGSPRLVAMLASLVEVPLVSQTFRNYSPDELLRSARQHGEIVRAIGAGDPEAAAAIMRAHVLAARQVFRALEQSTDRAGRGDVAAGRTAQ